MQVFLDALDQQPLSAVLEDAERQNTESIVPRDIEKINSIGVYLTKGGIEQ